MTGDRERFRAVMALVDKALDLPEAERDAVLRKCDDDGVRAEAVRVLNADARAGDFLSESMVHRARPGVVIGPFCLVSLLGRGGMGEVWVAERTSDFEQRVAVKVLPVAADEAAVARFRRERQILARLLHPRIAKLIDGGVTRDERPWLAMELVDGIDVMKHAEREALDIDARLRLFVEICEAVQFAHQNLVVHRDLKPSNVLVTRAGEPKLLDFGIAKLMESDDRELTRTNERPMTLEYAAPEQVRGEAVTTASDVWALGVMLHELLCGARPYAASGSRVDVERAILASAPSRPSAVATDAKIRRRLRGDLDAIVLKAMRRDPRDRYPSAEALATDVRRHLEHAPVSARGGARSYVLRATIRQHRVAFAVSALVLASLIAGLASTLWQARRARDEARRAGEAQDFLISMLHTFDPHEAGGRAITERDILERGEARVAELRDEPEVQARLLRAFGETWYGLAEMKRAREPAERALALERATPGRRIDLADTLILVGDIDFEEGDLQSSVRRFEEALSIARQVEGPGGLTVARALNELAGSERRLTRYVEAETLRRRSLAIYEERRGSDDAATLGVMNDLAVLLGDEGRFAESADLQRRTCEHMARTLGENHPDTLSCWTNLARDLVELGKADEADGILVDVRDRQVKVFGDDWADLAFTLQWRGVALDARGRPNDALAVLDDAIDRVTRQGGPEHVQVASILVWRARVLVHLGRLAEAEASARRAIAIAMARLGEEHATVGRARLVLGDALLGEGRDDEARAELRRAAPTLGRALGASHVETKRAEAALARAESAP